MLRWLLIPMLAVAVAAEQDDTNPPNSVAEEPEDGLLLPVVADPDAPPLTSETLTFLRELRNVSRVSGDALRLRCEASGDPPATDFTWLKHGAPLMEEPARMRVRTRTTSEPQWSTLRIKPLETLDTAFYACRVSNGVDTIESSAVVRVTMGDGTRRTAADYDAEDEAGFLPESYSEPDFSGTVEFEGRQRPSHVAPRPGGGKLGSGIPNLRPDGKAGSCRPYEGSVCAKYVGQEYVFVAEGLSQHYVEQKLKAAFAAISTSPDLSPDCSPYAIPAVCLSTFPLCDRLTERPRRLCREECEVLENRICRKELAIARQYAALEKQLVLPECSTIPPVGSPESAGCARLGIPEVQGLVRPHNCYRDVDGEDGYRGTVSTTESGLVCRPWERHPALRDAALAGRHPGLAGGHNFCRMPDSLEGVREGGPWCYVSHGGQTFKESCGIPRCNDLASLYLYIGAPAALVCVALLGLCLGICCMKKGSSSRKDDKAAAASVNHPSSMAGSAVHGSNPVEMASLLPQEQQQQAPHLQQPQPQRQIQLREFPINSIRFMEELGEGAFGKVFKGELLEVTNATTGPTLVAIKTLKPGATQKTASDFRREAELMSELRHPNIVCLLGVSFTDDPHCMIFEVSKVYVRIGIHITLTTFSPQHMAHGDLHEFLINHSPNIDSDISEPGEDQNVLNPMDMSFIAIQIAAGMEYLASHHYVHRDLAARNCLVGDNLTVKISDFGLSRDIYSADYYRVQTKSLLPVRWMPPESILYGKFSTESDVWSFGVVLWEIYSYGLQPYYGYSNQEVIEMIRSRQLLPCPEDCPSRMYAFMVECWHEVPTRRPPFCEIHSRLRHWEGFAGGGYHASTTSHSVGGQSQHSGSHHSSTGPSNNTGSTGVSHGHFLYRGPGAAGGPQQAFPSHVQMGPGGQHTAMLGAYGAPIAARGYQPAPPPSTTHPPHHSSSSQNSNCQTPAGSASLQMV